jgi:hypothetical protein
LMILAVWPNGIVGCHSRFACLSLPSLDVGVDLKRVIRSLSFLVLSIHRLSLLVVSPGGSRPSPSFPAPSSGLWPLGVGYPRLPCTAFDTFGFSLCMGSNEAWFGPGIFLVSLECYCADVVSILSPPLATQCLYGNISRSETSPGQAKSFLMIFGSLAEWYSWMPFPLCLPLSALSRRRCRAEVGHPLSELSCVIDPPSESTSSVAGWIPA